MGWPYTFPDLSTADKLERRKILDLYGAIAQVSVVLPLLLTGILSLVARWLLSGQREHIQDGTSSPQLKRQSRNHRLSLANLTSTWRKYQWWLGDDLEILRYRLGTRGEVLGGATWTAWLLVCSFSQTGEDYFHVTKRFGTVAASQLPLQYLLAIKSPYSPLQKLTGTSHETINVAHQILSRIVITLLYCHAALYLNFYVLRGLLGEKLVQFYIICGIVGTMAFTAVGTTALAPVRQWSYCVFYATHVVLATLLLPLLYLHVSHIHIYIYETAAIYAMNAVLRTLVTKNRNGTIRILPDTDLVEIKVDDDKSSWTPGQHAYLSLPGNTLLRTFRSNPFTVASLPAVDGNLKFVARVRDGNTAKLARQGKFSENAQRINLEGPYGIPSHPDRLLGYDRVLFVAGGVGGTFVAPLYRQLLSDLSPGRGTYRRQKVSFLWVVRSIADVTWALPVEAKEREGFVERLKVCVTSAPGLQVRSQAVGRSDDHATDIAADVEEGIELEERKGLLPGGEAEDEDARTSGPSDLVVHAGRPDIKRVVGETIEHDSSERVAVVVCGPMGLSKALRREIRPWVMDKGRNVWFWEESFGL
ncbi:hypothetical protein MBLNU230_g0162t1 [Neophaeotheca triangularis]